MNLVDAIRMASQQRFQSAAEPRVAEPPHESAHVTGEESDSVQTVRFEVRLTNQQLHDLLQWLARNLHPVMTCARRRATCACIQRNCKHSPSRASSPRSRWTTSGDF